jgi:hypothetical protein
MSRVLVFMDEAPFEKNAVEKGVWLFFPASATS